MPGSNDLLRLRSAVAWCVGLDVVEVMRKLAGQLGLAVSGVGWLTGSKAASQCLFCAPEAAVQAEGGGDRPCLQHAVIAVTIARQ